MLNIILNTNIEYTYGDTFSLTIYPADEAEFTTGMQLRFVIAETEESEYIIDKLININDDLTFTINLLDDEKAKLPIKEYVYKISIIKNGVIETQKSGYFTVKWGA